MTGWHLEHTYADLPGVFHSPAPPTPVRTPEFVVFNTPLATELGLDAPALDSAEGAALFAGNTLPDDARPIAQAYAGHQFGHFTTLGDGRAILIGEQITPDGRRVDIQFKGAGQTPYSRRGDGRAALGPMLRELIISEAMHALGIASTRSLAVVSTGEPVYRERELPGAVLTRVASSHLRVGTFEWAAAHPDPAVVSALADYTIDRHFPEARESERPYLTLFQMVVERQTALVAQWQLVGFVHGVMNTDNMSIAGETIDYGPCAFMDRYDPDTVFSSIDSQGRYAYGNQPAIARWNLARLAEALLSILDADQARAVEMATPVLENFAPRFHQHWITGMRAKLGLFEEQDGDPALVDALLEWMHHSKADFTDTFRRLSTSATADAFAPDDPLFRSWHERWQRRLEQQPQSTGDVRVLMQRHNPAVIARNHKVEEALEAAEQGRIDVLTRLLEAVARPYDYPRAAPEFAAVPSGNGRAYRTFCGT